MENLRCLFANFPWDILLFGLALGGLLWWALNSLIGGRLRSHSAELQDRINFLEGELEACRKSKVAAPSAPSVAASVAAPVAAAVVAKAAAPLAAAPVVSAPVAAAPVAAAVSGKKDDLKIVEGIGPKIEELCNNAGILTFAQLAATAPSRIKEILEAAGPRFQMHDPTTWPDQSALARDGKFDELKKWQDELNRGK